MIEERWFETGKEEKNCKNICIWTEKDNNYSPLLAPAFVPFAGEAFASINSHTVDHSRSLKLSHTVDHILSLQVLLLGH